MKHIICRLYAHQSLVSYRRLEIKYFLFRSDNPDSALTGLIESNIKLLSGIVEELQTIDTFINPDELDEAEDAEDVEADLVAAI